MRKNIDLDKQNIFQLNEIQMIILFCLEYIETRCFKLVIVHIEIVVKSKACTIRH